MAYSSEVVKLYSNYSVLQVIEAILVDTVYCESRRGIKRYELTIAVEVAWTYIVGMDDRLSRSSPTSAHRWPRVLSSDTVITIFTVVIVIIMFAAMIRSDYLLLDDWWGSDCDCQPWKPYRSPIISLVIGKAVLSSTGRESQSCCAASNISRSMILSLLDLQLSNSRPMLLPGRVKSLFLDRRMSITCSRIR